MSCEHHVVIGPGLDGETKGIKFLTSNWLSKYDLHPDVLEIVWKSNISFSEMLETVLSRIEWHLEKGHIVSLVGCSASASLILNAFAENPKNIKSAVNLCGYLRPREGRGLRSFTKRSEVSEAFRESVLRFSEIEHQLSQSERGKVLTVSSLYDELVPPEAVILAGATNERLPMAEHVVTIALALVKYDPVISFLKRNDI